MLHARDLIADLGMDSQFLFQFTPEGIAWLLTFFNFSAWKFPLQRHRLVARALADEYLPQLHDHRSYNPFHGFDTVPACSALATGSTQPVKVKANAAIPGEQSSSNSCSPNSGFCSKKYIRGESTTI